MSWSRRTFLRALGGAGALVALPSLEIFSSVGRRARAAVGDGPRRLVFFYTANGMHMPAWTPAELGAGWTSPILDELGDMKSEALVVSGLQNLPGQPDGAGDHGAGTGAYLTCRHVRKTDGDDIASGISVDQVAAQAFGQATRYASIELGLEGGAGLGGCDSGYSCAYTRNIAWAGEQTPLPKVTNPRVVFDRLFAGYDPNQTEAVRERRLRQKKSVLDWVRGEATSLQARLGADDRQKLEEYLTGVRSLEERIDQSGDLVCDPGARPSEIYDPEVHVELMSDLLVTAFRCDLTRVATFMLGNGGSGKNYAFVDPTIVGGHHDISHHMDNPDNFRMLEIIDKWQVRQVASFARKLAALTDSDGERVLDRTVVYLSSEIADGNAHSHTDLPVLLLGRGGGAITPGHIRRDGEPLANLFITLLAAAGVAVESFGDDSTGPLSI